MSQKNDTIEYFKISIKFEYWRNLAYACDFYT